MSRASVGDLQETDAASDLLIFLVCWLLFWISESFFIGSRWQIVVLDRSLASVGRVCNFCRGINFSRFDDLFSFRRYQLVTPADAMMRFKEEIVDLWDDAIYLWFVFSEHLCCVCHSLKFYCCSYHGVRSDFTMSSFIQVEGPLVEIAVFRVVRMGDTMCYATLAGMQESYYELMLLCNLTFFFQGFAFVFLSLGRWDWYEAWIC